MDQITNQIRWPSREVVEIQQQKTIQNTMGHVLFLLNQQQVHCFFFSSRLLVMSQEYVRNSRMDRKTLWSDMWPQRENGKKKMLPNLVGGRWLRYLQRFDTMSLRLWLWPLGEEAPRGGASAEEEEDKEEEEASRTWAGIKLCDNQHPKSHRIESPEGEEVSFVAP